MQNSPRLLSIALLLMLCVSTAHPARRMLRQSSKINMRKLQQTGSGATATESAALVEASSQQSVDPMYGGSEVRWAADMDDVTPPTPIQELKDVSVGPAQASEASSMSYSQYTTTYATSQGWESDSDTAPAGSRLPPDPSDGSSSDSNWDYGDEYAAAASTAELTDASISPPAELATDAGPSTSPSNTTSEASDATSNAGSINDQPAGPVISLPGQPVDESISYSLPTETTDYAKDYDAAQQGAENTQEQGPLTGPGIVESLPDTAYGSGSNVNRTAAVPDWGLDLDQPDAATDGADPALQNSTTTVDNSSSSLPPSEEFVNPWPSLHDATDYAAQWPGPFAVPIELPSGFLLGPYGPNLDTLQTHLENGYGYPGLAGHDIFGSQHIGSYGGEEPIQEELLLIDESQWHIWVDADDQAERSIFSRAPFKASTLADVYLGAVSASSRAHMSWTAVMVSTLVAAAFLPCSCGMAAVFHP